MAYETSTDGATAQLEQPRPHLTKSGAFSTATSLTRDWVNTELQRSHCWITATQPASGYSDEQTEPETLGVLQ